MIPNTPQAAATIGNDSDAIPADDDAVSRVLSERAGPITSFTYDTTPSEQGSLVQHVASVAAELGSGVHPVESVLDQVGIAVTLLPFLFAGLLPRNHRLT